MRLVFLVLCVVSSLLAQETLVTIESIETLYNKKSYEDACVVSEDLFKKNPNGFEANIYYGRCALHHGDVKKAMAAFDRAEIIDEQSAVAHKYLGDLYAFMGDVALANDEYDKAEILGNQPVSREVSNARNLHAFSLLMRLGAGNDSNVNYSAELSEMLDWGYATKSESDNFTKEYLRLNHVYDSNPSSAFYYKSQLHAYNKNYTIFHEEDFTQGNFYTGPGWGSKTFDIWVPLGYVYMTTDYEGYAQLYSISPQLRKKFDNEILLKLETNFEYQRYLQWNEGDKLIYSAKLGVSRWFGDNYLRAAYRYLRTEKENKDTPRIFLDKYFHELEFNYIRKVTKSLEAGVGFLYRKSKYTDLARVGVSDAREDELYQYSAYMAYNLTKELGIAVEYENYDNNTNYTPSDYTKEVVGVGLYLYF